MKEKLPRHESMRGWFAYELHEHMSENKDIWIVCMDLGYGMFDRIRSDYSDRFLNVGASEQAGVGIAAGLAQEGKLPVVYSITTFLLYRPFELIRNYLEYEQLPVKLVGSGRDYDYSHDGWTHHSPDAGKILMNAFPYIKTYFPELKEDIPTEIKSFLYNGKPSFISLRR